jgi:hypothetical protein
MDEEAIRNTMADQMACAFIVEILLVGYLKQFPAGAARDSIVETIKKTGRRTDQFAGLAKTDRMAELLSDVTVRMHSALDGYLERALARLAAASG